MIARLVLALAVVASNGSVSLVGLYPNPATDGDVGEYVLLGSEGETSLAGYALTDGEDTIALPATRIDGTVAITDEPRVAALANETTIVVDQGLSLANAGESVHLQREGDPVSTLTYGRAPTAEVWDGTAWTPLGATDFPVATARSVPMTAFALPDGPSVPATHLDDADERIVLAGYTLTSSAVADRLLAAHRRGVRVSVLVDESPVGGTPASQITTLDRLAAAGIEVTASGGERARYQHHHAKYAVVDDAVLVTSENWKPAGVGGRASRGWGVVLHDEPLADHLGTVFAADAGGLDGQPWQEHSQPGQPGTMANATYPSRFEPIRANTDRVRVIVTPDNAERELRGLLDGATESIRIQQVSVDEDGPLLKAAIAAARRGVSVRILLGSAWYVERDNAALAANLTRVADEEDLPLSVKLAEPRSRYDHLHNKGVLVDRKHAVVGSLNWNRHALRENREVAVIVTDDAVGRYYARLFRADWRGAAWRIHWTTLGAIVIAGIAVVRYANTVDFEPPER